MGKGIIISHDGDGLYTVQLDYDTAGVDSLVSELTTMSSAIQEIIDDPESTETQIQYATARKLAVDKRISFLQNTDRVPANENVAAWCADLTTSLSGEVGTIEIGRERDGGVNIQPGYENNADYDSDRDGQLKPTMGLHPAMAFLNLGFLPGAQKWRPMYRYGTITDISYDDDTCDVDLDSATSSQQDLNINQSTSLSDVPIEYMSCNADAFGIGDEVLIKFENYDWDQPKVIGFKEEPKPCECWFEPWDGPNLTSKYPWQHGYAVYYATGTHPGDLSTFSITDGVATFGMGELPNDGSEWWEHNHYWYYWPAETPIRVSATRIKFTAYAEIDCSEMDPTPFFGMYLKGEDDAGEDVDFYIFVVEKHYWPWVGCDDYENVETEWEYKGNGYGVGWTKNILNGKTDFIDLPVSGVDITGITLFLDLTLVAGMAGDHFDWMPAVEMQVDHIEIC